MAVMKEDSMLPMFREFFEDLAESVGGVIVPPIKLAGDTLRIALSLPDRILWHKIDRFLAGISHDRQRAFAERVEADPALRQKIGEYLILALDKMDDLEKPEFLAKVFVAYLDKKINLETFRRLAASINAAFVVDLQHLGSSIDSILFAYLGNLLPSGLAEMMPEPLLDGGPSYRVSHLGRIFQQIMTDKPLTG